MTARRASGDAGQVGGLEAIPFGLLTFAVGTLLIANAWAVVDAKLATDVAAREAARAFVEADDLASATAAADRAARRTMEGFGRDATRAQVSADVGAGFARCERVVVEVAYEVPALSLPWIGGFGNGPFRVLARHTEVVDPFRSGLDGQAEDCA